MEQKQTPPVEKPTLGQLWQDIKKHKKLYYKVLSITFIVSAIITLSIPNYYKCTVMLAPELSGSNNSSSSLLSLASSFGIKLGGGNMGSEALFPTLYPDLMNSVTFRASLFPVIVQMENQDTIITYYDYLLNEQRLPWWLLTFKSVKEFVIELFVEEEDSRVVNPFKLTKEQYEVVKDMEDKVVCDVDKKTLVITIDITDQDPLIAATIADSVQKHLQDFITEYRTRKARIDLEYNKRIFNEAKEKYEKARVRYATFSDANRKVLFETMRSEQTKLENEMQIQYNIFCQAAAQLQLAESKVQEDTPAFTTLQPASVPVKKAGPKRAKTCLLILSLAVFCISCYVFNKEGHLKPFLQSSKKHEEEFLRTLKMLQNK